MDQTQQSGLFELTDEQKNKLYIGPFKGDYRWLSNFWESTITIAGQEYPTVEHFYQASKTNDVEEAKRILNLDTPGKAKKAGAYLTLREDWEQVKTSVMLLATYSKFSQNKELTKRLLKTGETEIIEINYWCDNFWGDCRCEKCIEAEGANKLGRIIMKVRKNLGNIDLY